MRIRTFIPLTALTTLLATGCGGRTGLDDFSLARPGIPDFTAGTSDSEMDGGAEDTFIGASCERDNDCGDVFECIDEITLTDTVELEGGYCTAVDCEEDDDCGEGAICVGSALTDSLCVVACEEDDDCRRGYECAEFSDDSGTVCLPEVEDPDNSFICDLICDDDADIPACNDAINANSEDLPSSCELPGGDTNGGTNGGFNGGFIGGDDNGGGNNGGFNGGFIGGDDNGGFDFPDGGFNFPDGGFGGFGGFDGGGGNTGFGGG